MTDYQNSLISWFKKGYEDKKAGNPYDESEKGKLEEGSAYLNGWCKYGLLSKPLEEYEEESLLYFARYDGNK